MARRRRGAVNLDDVLDSAFDSAMGAFFERAEDLIHRVSDGQARQIQKTASLREVYTCASCRKGFSLRQMEMVHPNNEFGLCKGCFSFMWNAAREKLTSFAKRRRRQAEAAPGGPEPRPKRRPPWEVLGVSQDATIDEIKRAYRRRAVKCHPDAVPAEERAEARIEFEELTRARDVMISVRSAPGK